MCYISLFYMDILYPFDFIMIFIVNIDYAHIAVGNGSVPIKGKRAILIAVFCSHQTTKELYKRQPQRALRLTSGSAQCSIGMGRN